MDSNQTRKQHERQVDDLISCAICLEHFVDPRILPCLHTYCLQCIHETASSNQGQFVCPMRDGTRIERDCIDSLPVNRDVRVMVEILPKVMNKNDRNQETSSIQCCNCHSIKADLWCQKCEGSYCTKCYETTHALPALKAHQSVPIDKKPGRPILCEEHLKEELRYWCESCQKLVCRDCMVFEHRDHKLAPIDQVANNTRVELRTELERIQSTLNPSLQNAIRMMSATEEVNRKTITDAFEALRTIINRYESELQQHIRAIETRNNQLIKDYQTQLTEKQQTLNKVSTDFEVILSTNDHTKLLQAKKILTESINKISGELDELKSPIKAEYRIEGVDQLQSAVDAILKQAQIVEKRQEICQMGNITPRGVGPYWQQLSGGLINVAQGSVGQIWGVNAQHNIFFKSSLDAEWYQVEGALKYISVGENGAVWGVNSNDYIFFRVGSSNSSPRGQHWQHMGGNLKQISVGPVGEVWGVNSLNDIYYRINVDTNWERIGGSLTQVSVGADGAVWGVNSNDDIYRRTQHEWQQIDGKLIHISSGGTGEVWGVNRGHDIYYRAAWNASWQHVAGKLMYIHVGGQGEVIGCNAQHQIYRRL